MARTTRADLDSLAATIDRVLGLSPGTHHIGHAYGRPRLHRDNGSRDVSPRLPAGELADWIRAFLAGADAALRPQHDPHR